MDSPKSDTSKEEERQRHHVVLWKKLGLCGTVCIAIWMIRDSDTSFNVFTALQQHEPSQRIFRSLLQVNLILWCTAMSLFAWRRIVEEHVIGELLFKPALHFLDGNDTTTIDGIRTQQQAMSSRCYGPVSTTTAVDEHHTIVFDQDKGDDEDGRDKRISEVELEEAVGHAKTGRNAINDDLLLADADYESDGEVREPTRITVPTVQSVINAALDNLLILLIALFLFTVSASGAFRHTDTGGVISDGWRMFSQIAAPTFPLLVFIYLAFTALFPWKKRSGFWIILSITTTAPWFDVTFRDGFIGDILTSSVRPLQDIAFTLFYLLFGLKGWWSAKYFLPDTARFINNADDSVPQMEKSWLLHTVVLPMCMVSPLWWRYLQNLRQSFDYKKRWPYLGNALKYFCAAQVAMFGVFHPEQQKSFWWLSSFVVATVYQIWWDIFMDWGLLELKQVNGMFFLQLRNRRLYKKKSFYWTICIVNIVLRFGWSLTFLPPRYLNTAGILQEGFEGHYYFFLGPTIASAEIIRRTLWGLLRFEWEAIKEMPTPASSNNKGDNTSPFSDRVGADNADHQPKQQGKSMDELGDLEMKPMGMQKDNPNYGYASNSLSFTSDMSSMNNAQILGELCLYATAFALIGALAAAHRGTF